MTQVLGIFRKDARQLRVEIALSLAIAAALVWVIPMQWNGPVETLWGAANHRMLELEMMTRALSVLLVISWMLLIVRAVHAEALVGDRQFWVTRPYEWKSLLAAKALFVGAFVMLPLVLMQCAVLLRAGLNPLASLGGLAFDLLLVAGILIAPMMAVAAVTSDFVKMALSLVAVVLLLVGRVYAVTMHRSYTVPTWLLGRWLLLGNLLLPNTGEPGAGRHPQLTIALLLLAVSGAALLVQYARRRTAVARGILLAPAAVLLVSVLVAAAHASGTANQFADPVYAALPAGETAPVELTYVPEAQMVPKMKTLYVSRGEDPVGMWILLRVSGLAADKAVFTGAYPRVTFTGADGFTWSVNSNEFHAEKIVPTSRVVQAGFRMPKEVYDRLKAGPVTIRLQFALTELQATTQEQLPMPDAGEDVAVPGYGVCGREYTKQATIDCRSAWKEPALTYATADWQDGPCAAGETELKQAGGWAWEGMVDDRDPAEFGISPVMPTRFGFTRDENNATGGKRLCPGARITLTQYRMVRQVETETVIRGFVLPED